VRDRERKEVHPVSHAQVGDKGRREERGARSSIPQIMDKNSLENAERTRERHILRKEGQDCLNMNTSVLRVDEVHFTRIYPCVCILIVFRWRSSLWKLVWKELLVYVVVFMIISVVYR
jgi:hypothetical protein